MTAGPGDALSHVALRLLAASHFQQGDEFFSAGDEGAPGRGPDRGPSFRALMHGPHILSGGTGPVGSSHSIIALLAKFHETIGDNFNNQYFQVI